MFQVAVAGQQKENGTAGCFFLLGFFSNTTPYAINTLIVYQVYFSDTISMLKYSGVGLNFQIYAVLLDSVIQCVSTAHLIDRWIERSKQLNTDNIRRKKL